MKTESQNNETMKDRDWSKTAFLAHASEDKPQVRLLYRRLKDNGLEPWLDEEDLDPGEPWETAIKSSIKKSRIFLACLTAKSVSKTGVVQRELRIALSQMELRPAGKVYFIPVLLEDIELPEITVGTVELSSFQAARAYNAQGMDKLISSLKKRLNIETELKLDEKEDLAVAKDLLSHGKTDKTIKSVKNYLVATNSDLQNDLILLEGRHNRLKKDNLSGILSSGNHRVESNKIVVALLALIEQAEIEN